MPGRRRADPVLPQECAIGIGPDLALRQQARACGVEVVGAIEGDDDDGKAGLAPADARYRHDASRSAGRDLGNPAPRLSIARTGAAAACGFTAGP